MSVLAGLCSGANTRVVKVSLSYIVVWLLGSAAHASDVNVPLDIGVGPAVHWIPGAVGKEQGVHLGAVISLQAVVDRRTFTANAPTKSRHLAAGAEQVRVNIAPWLPDTIYLSPKLDNTAIWGASWRLFGVGVPFTSGAIRSGIEVGPRITAMYVASDSLPTVEEPKGTFFFRPGVDVQAEVELELSDTVWISLGANSQVYVPQQIGGFGLGSKGNRIWMINQAFVKLHFRVPYKIDL
ncbi:MAG: hypothetical protein ACI9MC_000116 [Kiritimatiellia bacterium]|jgi:hypothetical protein